MQLIGEMRFARIKTLQNSRCCCAGEGIADLANWLGLSGQALNYPFFEAPESTYGL